MPLDNQNPPLDSNTRDPYLYEELPDGYEEVCPDCDEPIEDCMCDPEDEDEDE